MAENSSLKLAQIPSSFLELGTKHNRLVDTLRTMTGTGMCSVLFSENKIIINVPTVSTTGGSVTVPDPLTIGTINVTNLNATNESVSYLIATSITSGFLSSTNVNATSVTATQFWGDLSAGSVTASSVNSTTVTATQFYGNVIGTSITATQFYGNLSGTSITASQFSGNLSANSVTASQFSGNLYGTSVTATQFYGNLSGASVTATQFHGDINATSVTATHIDGNITSTSITASYQIYTPRLIATTITTDNLYLEYLDSITVVAEDGIFDYLDSITASFDHLDSTTITATSITATSITSADFFGGAFRSTKNGVVTMDGRSVTFYVDAYTYGEVSATQYLSASSNSLAYYGQAGITISNNFTGKSMTVLASALSKDITLREIDVCDSGVPKKMLIIASAPY